MHFDNKEDVIRLLDAFYDREYRQIDTARNYLLSEALLGEADAADRLPPMRRSVVGEMETLSLQRSTRVSKSL